MKMRRIFVATILAASTIASVAIPRPAQAAVINLTTCLPADLIAAIVTANSTVADDTINLATACTQNPYADIRFADDYNDTVSALPAIADRAVAGKLTINGGGFASLVREPGNTPAFNFFELLAGANLQLNGLELINGAADYGGAIDTNGTSTAPTNLVTSRVRFYDNSATQRGGAVWVGSFDTAQLNYAYFTRNYTVNTGSSGGAVFVQGPTEIYYSSFYNNTAGQGAATSGSGGAITQLSGTLLMRETSLSNNTALGSGGAFLLAAGTADIQRSTFTNNTADSDADGAGDGGGIFTNTGSGVVLNMTNTIVAGNNDNSTATADKYPDVRGQFSSTTAPAGRNNLIGVDYGVSGLLNGTNGNRIGTIASPLNPQLVQDIAGKEVPYVYIPRASSPAINSGLNTTGIFQLDQRGVRRILYGTVDIGAVEYKRPDSPAVILPSTGAWLFRYTNTTGPVDTSFLYGQGITDYTPVTGDWDGNGTDTQGVYTRFTANNIGVFALSNQLNGFDAVNFPAFPYTDASANWIPVKGDWDGDGDDTIGAYNIVTGLWSLNDQNQSNAPEYTFVYGGGAGILPVTGDWDGDGDDTIGVFNFGTGNWLLSNSITSPAVSITAGYSAPGFFPIPGDWDGDGDDTLGLYRPSTGDWRLRNTASTGTTDISLIFGADSNLKGVSGKWLPVTEGGGASPIRESAATQVAPEIAPTFAP